MCASSSQELSQLDKQRLALNRSAAYDQVPWSLYAALLRNAPTLHAAHELYKLVKGRVLSSFDLARSQSSKHLSEEEVRIFDDVIQAFLSNVDFRDPSRDPSADLSAIIGIVNLSTTFQAKTTTLGAVLRNDTYVL